LRDELANAPAGGIDEPAGAKANEVDMRARA